MNLSKKEFRKKEKELMLRATEIEAQNIDADPGLFEEYRDGFRFMAKLSQYTFILALIFNVVTSVVLFLKEPGKTYLTSRDGKLREIVAIAETRSEMQAIYAKYENEPEKMLEIRNAYNPTTETVE